jgi:hypothetical protein
MSYLEQQRSIPKIKGGSRCVDPPQALNRLQRNSMIVFHRNDRNVSEAAIIFASREIRITDTNIAAACASDAKNLARLEIEKDKT